MKNTKKIFIMLSLIMVVVLIFCSLVFYKFVYNKEKTFQGKILEINGNTIIVEAIETDDSKYVGEFIFEISDNTILEAFGKQIDLNTIKSTFQHSVVEITFSGKISETSPAKISHIKKVELVVESDLAILVFLDENITIEEQEIIKQGIQAIDGVKSIEFKSKEKVKNEMMENSETFNEIMINWNDEDNPLKDEFVVKTNDYTKKEKIVHLIENIEKVDTVK